MVAVRPDEVSAILREQLAGAKTEAQLEEVGTVLQVGDGVARIYGLTKVQAGELIVFENGLKALALNLEEDNVGAVLLGESTEIKEGDTVKRTGEIAAVKVDEGYETKTARALDVGFQAWNRGVMMEAIDADPDKLLHKENLSVEDDYIFIRKFYKRHRVYYFLIKNLLSLRNPSKEIRAFLNTSDVQKETLIHPHAEYPEYDSFDSPMLKQRPKVSVIIPTLNRYDYLKDVLQDLEVQDYSNFEIIIVDQTDEPDKDFYNDFNLDKKVIFQEGKGQRS